jgi:hypothetical protein
MDTASNAVVIFAPVHTFDSGGDNECGGTNPGTRVRPTFGFHENL